MLQSGRKGAGPIARLTLSSLPLAAANPFTLANVTDLQSLRQEFRGGAHPLTGSRMQIWRPFLTICFIQAYLYNLVLTSSDD